MLYYFYTNIYLDDCNEDNVCTKLSVQVFFEHENADRGAFDRYGIQSEPSYPEYTDIYSVIDVNTGEEVPSYVWEGDSNIYDGLMEDIKNKRVYTLN